jgi:hypothetical protein
MHGQVKIERVMARLKIDELNTQVCKYFLKLRKYLPRRQSDWLLERKLVNVLVCGCVISQGADKIRMQQTMKQVLAGFTAHGQASSYIRP